MSRSRAALCALATIVVGALGSDAQAQTYAAQVSCTNGPYRVRLPQSYRALRGIGQLRRERILKTEDSGTQRELRFNGLELVVVTLPDKPSQYRLSKAIVSSPNWRIAGPLRVGTPAKTALRGLLKDPPRDGEVELNGDRDTIRVNLAAGRVLDVEYFCQE